MSQMYSELLLKWLKGYLHSHGTLISPVGPVQGLHSISLSSLLNKLQSAALVVMTFKQGSSLSVLHKDPSAVVMDPLHRKSVGQELHLCPHIRVGQWRILTCCVRNID